MLDLVTIPFSHYCEKARWALDRAGLAYRERRYLPGLHVWAARRALEGTGAGRADAHSSRFSTPILLGAGAPLADSSDIARFADPSLFDDPQAARLDGHYGEALGPHTRRVAYWFCLEEPAMLFALAKKNAPVPQALALRLAFPLLAGRLREGMKIDRAGYERSLDVTRRVADEAAALLADGRRYLVGDRFSAADLALASMLMPVVMPPPEHCGAVLPQPEALSEAPRALAREMRAHPAGAFAMRMFAEERWRR
ncbi:MAG: glutathione S-transferase C-terminal domain-containing protein [Sandaracinaceae bacterium]|nr:glutathione S-transferase C-terminal domain-containing protein [Sandaracinaceae bacterium]